MSDSSYARQALEDHIARTVSAVHAARRSSRFRGLHFLVREGVAVTVMIAIAAVLLWSRVHPIIIAGALGSIALAAWTTAMIAYAHVFSCSDEADSELMLAYTNVERAVAELDSGRGLGWGQQTPSEWSYQRQLAALAQLERDVSRLRSMPATSAGPSA